MEEIRNDDKQQTTLTTSSSLAPSDLRASPMLEYGDGFHPEECRDAES